ncbi:MAG: hypothetical protein HYS04_04010 [Acidobacteria bacterium]|nr:hypothetical protein [Acidobacteriota bacterium]
MVPDVPLSYNRRVVAGLPQLLDYCGADALAELKRAIAAQPVLVGLQAAQQNTAARRALRRAHHRVGEVNAARGQAVQVRRPNMRVARRAEALVVMIVAEDENDVGAALGRAGNSVGGHPGEQLPAGEFHGLRI